MVLNIKEEKIRNDHHLVSPTAKLVAHFRRYSDIPHSEYIAEEIGAEQTACELIGGADKLSKLTWMAPMLEVRYKGVNAQIRKNGFKNILEVASGVNPRPLEFSDNSNCVYVSTDLRDMIHEQKRLYEKILAGQKRSNLHQHEMNALNSRDLERSVAHFNGNPYAVVHEGLLPYFSHEEKGIFAENLRKVIPKNGAWITPDIMTKQRLDMMLDKAPDLIHVLTLISGVTQRDLRENAFDDDNHALKYFKDNGFDVERNPSFDGSYELTSPSKVYVPAERLPFTKTRETWVMRPKK